MTVNKQTIDTFLQAGLDSYIQETAELCAQPSVSAKGEGTHACAELVARILERHGFRTATFQTPGNPVVVGQAEGQSERTLLCYNHYDVQPVEPLDLWTTPPFAPSVRDGALYARGAKDDKGEFIARLAAIDAVRAANGGALPCNVTFVVEGEEEIGSPHIAQFVQQHLDLLRCQGAIWEEGAMSPDGHPLNLLGVRGILAVEISVETMTRDAHSGGAHILPSAAWRLLRVLESLKGPDERIHIPGFYDAIQPLSATDIAVLQALPSHEETYRQVYGVKEFVLGRTGNELDQAVFDPTCNIQGITTGYQGAGIKTVIPARGSAKLDFRLVPDQDPDDIFAKLRAYLDGQGYADVVMTRSGAMWPARTPADDPLVQLSTRAGAEVYDLPPILDPMAGGSSPVYAFARPLGGIPVITAGVGYWDNRAHAPNEHVRLGDFLNGARHIARILLGFAEL